MSATISLYITHRSHYVYSNMLSLLYKEVLRAGLFPGWASFVPLIYTHGGRLWRGRRARKGASL